MNTNIRAVVSNAVVVKGGQVVLSADHRRNILRNMNLLSSVTGKTIKEILRNAGDSGLRYETYCRFAHHHNGYSSYHLKSTIDRLAQLAGQPTDKFLQALTMQDIKNSVLAKNSKVYTFPLTSHSVEIRNGNVVVTAKKVN